MNEESTGLFGSSIQPPTVYIWPRGEVQLGEIVRRAFRDSRLSVKDWNNLPVPYREDRIAKALGDMVYEAQQ